MGGEGWWREDERRDFGSAQPRTDLFPQGGGRCGGGEPSVFSGLALPSMAWNPLENGTLIKKEGAAPSFGAGDVRRHKPGVLFGEKEQAEDGRGQAPVKQAPVESQSED